MKNRILIVDDTPENIQILSSLLKNDYNISIATNGKDALNIIRNTAPDLILLDIMMPDMDGYELIRRLKKAGFKNIPVLFVTAKNAQADETMGLSLGAVDYITKPVCPTILQARVRTHMRLHLYQEKLEDLVKDQTKQLEQGYIETVYRLTLVSEYKDEETGAHIKRISHYCRQLSELMGQDPEFCTIIFYASPMHDIGKVAIPDAILLKQGPLDKKEWKIMRTHASIGAQILKGSDSPYLKMAVDIAGCHHERWDGSGYPNGIKGEHIPLPARIMNLCDQYDALRSKRPYKPPFSHEKTTEIIINGDGRTLPIHFDPQILFTFKRYKDLFNDIYETYKD